MSIQNARPASPTIRLATSSEVAALMADIGLIVLVALISPTRSARHYARSIFGNERFVEVIVDTPPC